MVPSMDLASGLDEISEADGSVPAVVLCILISSGAVIGALGMPVLG